MLISKEGCEAIQLVNAQQVEIEQLKAENKQLKATIETQGEGCEERHNVICEIHEITERYFKQFKEDD